MALPGDLISTMHDASPRLAWVVDIDRRTSATRLIHGAGVEVHGNFAVEGTWDGPFASGRFDAAAHFFGSGLRVDEEGVVCSASSALVDRLLYAESPGRFLCSNSLPLILAHADARLDADHDYTPECRALMAGRRHYPRGLHVRARDPDMRLGQAYAENIRLTTGGAVHVPRVPPPVRLDGYDDYHAALRDALAALVDNLRDGARHHAVRAATTVSTGYDSAAVAALAKVHGILDCFTTSPSQDPALEDGAAVARAMGLRPTLLARNATDPAVELALLSATLDGRESVFASMVETLRDQNGVTALFTGYHGDKMWGRDTHGVHMSPDVMRGDTSGLNLSEARLHAGFINIAVPFVHAERIAEVVAISNSAEMAAWQLGNDYDRPIPRRIVESAGVPRALFGQRKSVVMDYGLWPRSEPLREALRLHLRQRHGYGRVSHLVHEAAGSLDYRLEALRRGNDALALRKRLWPAERQLANRIFVWSVNESAQRLQSTSM